MENAGAELSLGPCAEGGGATGLSTQPETSAIANDVVKRRAVRRDLWLRIGEITRRLLSWLTGSAQNTIVCRTRKRLSALRLAPTLPSLQPERFDRFASTGLMIFCLKPDRARSIAVEMASLTKAMTPYEKKKRRSQRNRRFLVLNR